MSSHFWRALGLNRKQQKSKTPSHRVRLGWEGLEDRTVPAYVPLGADTLVNAFTSTDQQSSAMAMNQSNGNFVVVWESTNQFSGTSGKDIYAQLYNASGAKVGSEFRVNTTTANDQAAPDVAMDNAGNFVVTWTSTGQDQGSSLGVYAQRYNSSGTAQGGEFRVNNTTQYDQFDSSIAMDTSGNFVVTWTSGTDNPLAFPAPQDGFGNLYGVYAARYNSAGTRQTLNGSTNDFRINQTTAGVQGFATVAMDTSANFVVAWTSTGQESGQGDSSAVFIRRFNSTATSNTAESRVNQTVIGEQFLPKVALNSVGSAFVVVYASNQDDQVTQRNDVWARRYSISGGVVTATSNEFKVNTYQPGEQYLHTAAMDTAGNFVVAWSSGYDNVVNPPPEIQQDGSDYGVYMQRYFANGTTDGGEYRVNNFTTGNQWQPAVAMRNSTGNFWLSWSSIGQDAAGTYGVYQKQYGPNTIPTANAGGPYNVAEGSSLALSGSGTDPDFGQTLTYTWDVNGDGIYGDATGATPTLTWSQLQALGINDGPSNRIVRLRTSDGYDTTTSTQATLTITNTAPTVGVTVQSAAVRGEVFTVALSATDPSSGDTAGTFTYEIDWNNDNVVDQVLFAGTSVNVNYAYASNGTYTLRARVTDKDGGVSGWSSNVVTVTRYRTAPNPNNGSLTDLILGGLDIEDGIMLSAGSSFVPSASNTSVFFYNFNAPGEGSQLVEGITGRVVVYLQGGDDLLINLPADPSLDRPLFIDGGTGSDVIVGGILDDTLYGGDGDDVIVALTGDDSIFGGAGNDFIVAGFGADTVFGGAGSDWIIAGDLSDTEDVPEGAVDEWQFGGSYASRTNNVLNGGGLNTGPVIPGFHVVDDTSADAVYGEADEDFFWMDLTQDISPDRVLTEVQVAL